MSQPLRQLLPAAGGGSQEPKPPQSLASVPNIDVPRRISIAAACDSCRSRRSKCDGQRPSCAACVSRGIDCEYDTEPTETRIQALKRKIKALNLKLGAHEELYEFLSTRSDAEIALILDRIKGGMDISCLQTLIQDGQVLLQFAQPAKHPPEQRNNSAVAVKRLKSQASQGNPAVNGEVDDESSGNSPASRGGRVPISALLQDDTDTSK